ncbi:ATP-binding protein transporter YOR1 [Fusarium sp. NRRL 52700]|nr:ATP-binding protein transporter YOR1 [Fusarium sp. NRRL 52700]
MSLVSNDTARIEQALAAFHLSWLSLYQLILTVALLVCNLGWTALLGATTLIFGLTAVTYATRPLVQSRNRINIVTVQRVTLTQKILQSIRFVKYFGCEGFFQSRLGNIKASETRALRIMHLIRCAVGTLAQFLPVLAIMITFIVYEVVNGNLDPAVIFSSFAMLYLLRVPTNWLPVSLSLAADAVQSIKGIEDFLLAEIIWMVYRRIEAVGTYEELMKSHPAFASLVAVGGHQQKEADTTEGQKGDSVGTDNTTTKAEVLMQEEAKIIDSVPFSVYVSWLRASGSLWNGLAMIVGQLLFRASSILGGLWLSWWVDNTYGLARGQNIGIYAGLSLAQCVLVFSSSLITCLTLRAPMSFFDTTPLGRIIYRFTGDIDALDNNLVVAVQQLLINVAALLGSYVLIVAYFYYFAIALVFGATALWWCISYYRSSARELRRHQLILDSVVFARLNEALIGAACIRAYDRDLQFVKLVHEAIDDMDSANFLTFASHNWLSVRLDNIGILLNLVTGILVVTNALLVALSISGLLLTYSMSMVGMMQVVVKYLIEIDNSMPNTERLFQYTNSLRQEVPLNGASVRPSWPEHGAIEYKAIQMRYRPGLPLVVDNFCLRTAGGERLGIVGHTSAGKSTILSTLFKLTEISGGHMTIDGIDIGQIGLHRLRSALAIIPQDPTLFQDSEKQFTMPEGDAQTSSVMEREDPENTDSRKPRETRVTLDTAVETEGLSFSLGQRQLIALARALLRNTRIVLVDEGTSSVDPETDTLVQETLATGLEGKTLIAIAHRLRTVIHYDRVCVMDKGKIVELGAPLELWEQGGIFRAMCDSNGITRAMFASVW